MARRPIPPVERFWPKVAKGDGCWEWLAFKDARGYGYFHVSASERVPAFRFAWEIENGPVPVGLELDHLCRNRGCVNPAHLEAVTRRENILRSESFIAQNARKTHCKRGHEFTPENTRRKNGGRECRECDRIRQRKVAR